MPQLPATTGVPCEHHARRACARAGSSPRGSARHRGLPAPTDRHQRGDLPHSGLLTRVDPAPQRHPHPLLRRPRGDTRGHGRHGRGKALADAGAAPDEVDQILVATMSDVGTAGTGAAADGLAAEVARRLGTAAPAERVSAACAGFTVGLSWPPRPSRAARPAPAWSSASNACPTSSTRRTARPPSCSRTGRARPWSAAARSRASGPRSGAPIPHCARPSPCGRSRAGRPRHPHAGLDGLPLGGDAPARHRPGRAGPLGRRPRRRPGVRPAPGQPAHHRGGRGERGLPRRGRRGPRHRRPGQHLRGVDPLALNRMRTSGTLRGETSRSWSASARA